MLVINRNLFILCWLLFTFSLNADAKCSFYGMCNTDDRGLEQYCVPYFDIPTQPKPLDESDPNYEEAISGIREYCPHLLDENGKTKDLCCDPAQVIAVADGFKKSAPFKRCPSCAKNIYSLFCEITCSPNQHEFVTHYNFKPAPQHWPRRYVTDFDLNIYESTMNKVYASCKDVSMPSTGGLVIESACGTSGKCSPERFFEFTTDPVKNLFSPFKMNFNPVNDSVVGAVNSTSYSCEEAWPDSISCGCVDCPSSCDGNKFDVIDDTFLLFGQFKIISFAVSMLILIMGLTSMAVIIIFRNTSCKIGGCGKIGSCTRIIKKYGDKVHQNLEDAFYVLGRVVVMNRFKVLAMCVVVMVFLAVGSLFLKVTSDPVELWASPDSRSRQEKKFFDDNFGPFYRSNQIFIKTVGVEPFQFESKDDGEITLGPAFNETFLNEVFRIQKLIENITFETTKADGTIITKGLESICYTPIRTIYSDEPSINDCTVISLLGLVENSIEKFNSNITTSYQTIIECLRSPYSMNCLAPYGGPILPGLALGGASHEKEYFDAVGVTLTFITSNKADKNELTDTMEWEKRFISLLKEYDVEERPDFMDIAFNAERSIEDEIAELSKSTAWTVAVSYSAMFIYITLSLGNITSCRHFMFESRISLAFGGIVIVFVSVICSVGLCAYFGITTTMITIEVIPFLVLAVGVDNIFIIVQTHQRSENNNKDITESIGRTMKKVGPSLVLTSISEILCFAISCLSTMPAVHTFALFATIAVLFNFIFQITAFVALLSLDVERHQKNRMDLFCCIKSGNPQKDNVPGMLQKFWINYYTPFIMKYPVRCVIMLLFTLSLCASILVSSWIEIGLDQKLSMPQGSHVLKYFEFMNSLLGIGVPVYWVTKGPIDYFDPDIYKNLCGGSNCSSSSVSTQLYMAAKQSNITYLSVQASSWLDDFKEWGESDSCCKYFKSNGYFCPHTYGSDNCDLCNYDSMGNMTQYEYFKRYLPHFLNDNPDPSCSKGGHAPYSGGINYITDENGLSTVIASYVMSYHTVAKNSSDFIGALKYARHIAENLTKTIDIPGVEIFPYGVFYVFYEQYLTIWADTLESLAYALLGVFVTHMIFTGFSIFSSAAVTVTVIMIIVHMMGLMWAWNISLNAISLVNLVMSVGIGVEFCGHIVHSFLHSSKDDPTDRAADALGDMGSKMAP
nr:Niemann-Pick type protein homolog 1B-like [Leptinotarsa decemlineata]